MNKRDSLGDRMKRYEAVAKTTLMRRTPVIIRIDGKAFHTFTRGFVRPFDDLLIASMQETTKYLCEHIQGCVLGYTQSDEITLVLEDYHDIDITPWYDNEVQKLCSITAAMATAAFNKFFYQHIDNWTTNYMDAWNHNAEDKKQYETYCKTYDKMPIFDARCFNVPVSEVTNCVLWRQQDCTRNSINMVAQTYFSHKELQGKSCDMMQDMLHEKFNINWNNYPTYKKRGTAVVKDEDGAWYIDYDMPILTGEGRDYIEKRITFEND